LSGGKKKIEGLYVLLVFELVIVVVVVLVLVLVLVVHVSLPRTAARA